MSYENILVETRGRVGLITLNRPKAAERAQRRADGRARRRARRLRRRRRIGCIVITGSEKAFAAGADIGAMKDWSYMDVYKSEYITRNWERIRTVRKPVIAAVAGFALGGGCELAMMCDFIIAADTREVRPARDQARHHPRRRRHAAPAARGRQGQGDGHGAHRRA